jgi:methyl-accepting chemotaxis protein
MHWLHQLKFSYKLSLIVFFPIAGLIFLTSHSIFKQYEQTQIAGRIMLLSDFSRYSSALVHELQKERGLSAGFLGSAGQKFSQQILEQHKTTDTQKEALNVFLQESDIDQDPELAPLIKKVLTELDQLQSIRNRTINLAISAPDAIGFYSKVNAQFLEIIAYLPHLSANAQMNSRLTAYANFLKGKERAGIERAVLSNTFAQDRFGDAMLEKLITLIAIQNTYTDVFLSSAPQDYEDFYHRTLTGKFVSETEKMRSIALQKGLAGQFSVDAAYWFEMQTGKINLLKDIEDFIAGNNQTNANQFKQDSWHAMRDQSLLVTVILTLASGLFILIRRDVLNQLGGEPQTVLHMAEQIAQGHLEQQNTKTIDHKGIFAAMKLMQQQLTQVVTTIYRSSEQITQASSEVNKASHSISQSACEQAASIEQTNATLEKIGQMVRQNFDDAKTTQDIAFEAVAKAIKGKQAVKDSMVSIENIAKKINLVEDIAYQINILSLNASIEAARAGQYGAGFSVVANEVRNLANRSQAAANEITDLTQHSVSVTQTAGKLLDEMVPAIQKTAELTEQITHSSQQQSEEIQQISEAVNQLDTVTQQNAAASEQLSATAQQLNDESGELMNEMQFFKLHKSL